MAAKLHAGSNHNRATKHNTPMKGTVNSSIDFSILKKPNNNNLAKKVFNRPESTNVTPKIASQFN